MKSCKHKLNHLLIASALMDKGRWCVSNLDFHEDMLEARDNSKMVVSLRAAIFPSGQSEHVNDQLLLSERDSHLFFNKSCT